MYTSEGPGHYAGEKTKILEGEVAQAICEEANRRKISIEMLLKSREPVESVVINTVLPFPSPEPETKTEEKTEAVPAEGNKGPEKDKPAPTEEEKQVS